MNDFMKKNVLFLLTTICYLAGKIDAQATTTSGLYISVLGGPSFIEDEKYQPRLFFGATGGYKFNNGLRLEEEITFQREKYSGSYIHRFNTGITKYHGKIDTLAFMTNILYEFDLGCKFKAYIGGGVGYAGSLMDHYDSSHSFNGFFNFPSKEHYKSYRNNFGWQVIAGVKYEFIKNWDFGLDYRFTNNVIYSKSHRVGVSITRFF